MLLTLMRKVPKPKYPSQSTRLISNPPIGRMSCILSHHSEFLFSGSLLSLAGLSIPAALPATIAPVTICPLCPALHQLLPTCFQLPPCRGQFTGLMLVHKVQLLVENFGLFDWRKVQVLSNPGDLIIWGVETDLWPL